MSREAPHGLRPVLYRSYPIGTLGLSDDGTGLSRVFLCQSGSDRPAPQGETTLTRWAAAELDVYFSGRRTAFTVPLSPRGTPFQRAYTPKVALPSSPVTGEFPMVLYPRASCADAGFPHKHMDRIVAVVATAESM